MTTPLLEIDDLTVRYRTRSGPVTGVSNATFSVGTGEYFGLVGESGCGKSTLAASIIGALDKNGYIDSGAIRYKGRDLTELSRKEMNQEIRWKEISWIPQASMNSLDPLLKVGDQAIAIAESHTDLTEKQAIEKFKDMFEIMGLQRERVNNYPHQFSGGMQQRAMIALALFLEPSLLIADEPTTALDVIMQDQIFSYFDRIKENLDTSMLLITHDISVVLESCEKVAIMHAGQMAETAPSTEIFESPRHPYSILLQRAFPDIRYPDRELEVITGNPPELLGDVDYCTFVERCPWASDECRIEEPSLEAVSSENGRSDHLVACLRKDEIYNERRAEMEGR